MNLLAKEIEHNYIAFDAKWQDDMMVVSSSLSTHKDKYLTSYKRLTSLQAWRTTVINARVSKESASFFLEAQNDALVSHVFARMGSWRSALKALRSCIENVLFCLYYNDHPVELELWTRHKHKIGFTALCEYFNSHPLVIDIPDPNVVGLNTLIPEYAELSKAVHGSAKAFTMTSGVDATQLWIDKIDSLGAWSAREGKTVLGVNLLLMTLFREELQGAKQESLRKSISLSVSDAKRKKVKEELKIALFKPS